MKRLRIMVAACLLLMVLPVKVQGNDQISDKDWMNGTYEVVVKAGHYSPYSTEISVTSVNPQTIKISGDVEGLPVAVYGKLIPGKSSQDKAVYDLNIHNALFYGQGLTTFTIKGQHKEISGHGGGTYTYMGRTGKCAANFTGTKQTVNSGSKYLVIIIALSAVSFLFYWWRQKSSHPR